MTKTAQIEQLQKALQWCLKHGVKAASWSETGFWAQAGYDGIAIMPPADLHVALAEAAAVIAQPDSGSGKP